jgi:DNA-binding response OmpR family regulator
MACDTLSSESEHRIVLDPHTTYDMLNQTLLRAGEIVHLTHNEQRLFDHLITHRQRTVTYEEIEGLIWAYEGMSMDALRSLVRGLRVKLGGEFIENISGVGYRLIA